MVIVERLVPRVASWHGQRNHPSKPDSGPDASPFFRIFNPDTQGDKCDPKRQYRDYWLTGNGAKEFAAAIPKSWNKTMARPR